MRLWRRPAQAGPSAGEASIDELRGEIAALTASNRIAPSRDTERRLLALRHLAGGRLIDDAPAAPAFAAADNALLPSGPALPEFRREQLTAPLLRAAILRDGCALVRGLVPRDDALHLAAGIDSAYAERERTEPPEGEQRQPGGELYDEFQPEDRFEAPWRPWIKLGGGLLAADSPPLSFELFELFERAGIPELVCDYLGEPALISVHKTTLRRAEPSVSGAWHQDGSFMGPVRSLNLWLSLSRCGDQAPGLDILPRRLDDYLAAGTEGAELSFTIADTMVQEAAAQTPIIRPVFEPGDALLFDELFLHKTGSDPEMANPRFAVESWFFGASKFPTDYAPLAV